MLPRFVVTLFIAVWFGLFLSSPAIATSSIEGTWRASDGSGSAQIGPCADDAVTLCASEITMTPGGLATGRVVVRGLRQASATRWRGTYLMGRERLPATVELRSYDLAAMTACRWVLCQTVTYERVRR